MEIQDNWGVYLEAEEAEAKNSLSLVLCMSCLLEMGTSEENGMEGQLKVGACLVRMRGCGPTELMHLDQGERWEVPGGSSWRGQEQL